MKKIILLLTIFSAVSACKKDEPVEQSPKEFKLISNKDISDYCNKHNDKFIIWYDEYAIKYGEISGESSRVDQSSVDQPVKGMQIGINALQVTQLLFYLSENCKDGWEVVSHSSDGILFQK
jgi:hypothetical protein